MSGSAHRQRLRGKTGCISCRNRRKKCDERRPNCVRCAISGRKCEWLGETQLVDRRYASHPKSRYSSTDSVALVCLRSENAAHKKLTLDLEVMISRHFIEKYYHFLLLPNCHRAFHDGWIQEIQELMVMDESLRYSVLANAASHIHNVDTNPAMQSISLHYYSKSIRRLADVLSLATNRYLASYNGFLMSVMLLYLHGCAGKSTYPDIPPHLYAAMRVLRLRLFEAPNRTLQPFDHLALESVLYQSFLTTTVLWSDQHPQTEFDLLFWRKAEHFLKQNTMFPEQPDSLNSPVLGVPVALFRLAIQAKQAYQLPGSCSSSELAQLRAEIEDWEAFVLGNGPVGVSNDINAFHRQQLYYDGATHLYVLIISLLLEQANAKSAPADQQDLQNARLPQALPKSTWQIQKALEVLHTFELDDDWSSCYIGTWPVYTMGFFLSEVKDIGLIRGEMDRRWRITNNMQIPRFRGDLEAAWLARGRSQDPHQMEV
ncbi:hypothetical protein HBH70_111440 [Parastagonospora nodorum]|nr:hypothetical protein HBH53_074110 [Parastagonospora nodorum]KAH3973824.1 hypothetical protein HBH52_137690 [Parastagonospora nodorum]KAH3998502.1 hypothetical protein HBI10_124660 [Parastagonospora nodorum]KAH4024251.1 hypothetical protein HBI13_084870 [Parastagonospora nodorum]KAH4046526.1 hypothetical protein HBH49_184500 [Parastagonospora nodorum]